MIYYAFIEMFYNKTFMGKRKKSGIRNLPGDSVIISAKTNNFSPAHFFNVVKVICVEERVTDKCEWSTNVYSSCPPLSRALYQQHLRYWPSGCRSRNRCRSSPWRFRSSLSAKKREAFSPHTHTELGLLMWMCFILLVYCFMEQHGMSASLLRVCGRTCCSTCITCFLQHCTAADWM